MVRREVRGEVMLLTERKSLWRVVGDNKVSKVVKRVSHKLPLKLRASPQAILYTKDQLGEGQSTIEELLEFINML